ncbi:legume-like lectin family-domain-containing protein [Hygrophoropsis aurantiaca]|uniref:Legume-like lectin family-domain-containing protein n=1 Tax=Hygrophoropsis aurantiaca TaxID=72124 RepID=A0ACB8A304_9AGAM|nr:legume-like lectin family-domain-containing protein [Hygrophoropsis aurantiaca]
MLTRFFTVLYLALAFRLLPGGLAAKKDTKIGDRTIERAVQLRTHSIFPPYIDQDLQNRWWDFGGDAYINTNKHIRLTRPKSSQMGWLWSRLPLTSTNYVVEIEFKVSGESTHLFGDGLAVWLTTSRAEPGPVFGSIDKFEGLGIFLDTYANGRHPYGFPRIVGMLGNGSAAYDHDHDGEANSIGGCSANFRRTNVITKLKLTYVKDSYLDVKVHYRAWDDWSDCFRVEGISLPEAPYLGISALTGEVHDAHDVISVTSWSAVLSPTSQPRDKLSNGSIFSRNRGTEKSSGSWLGFFFKTFLFAGVCFGAFQGYKMYVVRNRRGGFGSNGFGGLGELGDRLGYNSGKRF